MLPTSASIFVATVAIDLRWSFDILAGIVKDQLRGDPRAGDLFVFHNRARTRIKILFYDRTGYCLLYKRLDRGTFPLPTVIAPGAAHVEVSAAELHLLMKGLDVARDDRSAKTSSPKKEKPTTH
jgi:transposase